MWPVSDAWDASVRSGFTALARAELWRDGALLTGLEVLGGSVRFTESSAVRRSLSLTVADVGLSVSGFWERYSPDDTDVRVWAGQGRVDGDEEYVPVFWGRLSRPSWSSPLSGIDIEADDYAAVMQRARLLRPWVTAAGADVLGEITALAQDVDASIEVIDASGLSTPARAAASTWDRDRWDAIESLARSIGCEAAFAPPRPHCRPGEVHRQRSCGKGS